MIGDTYIIAMILLVVLLDVSSTFMFFSVPIMKLPTIIECLVSQLSRESNCFSSNILVFWKCYNCSEQGITFSDYMDIVSTHVYAMA